MKLSRATNFKQFVFEVGRRLYPEGYFLVGRAEALGFAKLSEHDKFKYVVAFPSAQLQLAEHQ